MSNLNTASQHLVEDVSPFLHDADVVRRGVGTLAVLDGVDEAVPELLDGPEQVLLDEVHHAVVCEWEESHTFERRARESEAEACEVSVRPGGLTFNKVVLQRRPGQHHPPPSPDGVHGFGHSGSFVLQDVTFVADHQVWTWSKAEGWRKSDLFVARQ